MASQQQKGGPAGHYSGLNRIPNIREFAASLDRDKKERDAQLEAKVKAEQARQHAEAHNHDGNASKPNSPDHVAPSEDDALHQQQLRAKQGQTRTVTDPVTGKEVEIADVDMDIQKVVEEPKLSVPNANLGKEATIKTDPTQSEEEYREAQDVTAPPDPVAQGATTDVPLNGEKTNILFHPTPSVSYEPMFAVLEQRATILCGVVFGAILLVGKFLGGGLFGMFWLAVFVSSGIFLWVKDLVRQGRDKEWSSEQKRGETATANLIPESTEWLNALLSVVWGLVNPEMFSAVEDTIEDVMQASLPSVIEHVKVSDLTLGNNALRILSMRSLPDGHMKEVTDEMHRVNEKTKDPQELAADEEGGEFYNLEVSFAYHSKPSASITAATNMGLKTDFFLGLKGLFGVPLPIWVELVGLVGTVRLRLQMTPGPPFIKTVTMTLMGVPSVQASCKPMMEHAPNILNLPLISNFVNWAIKTAAGMYVAPKSLSLDVGKMLQGDDILKDTNALGAIFIRIHKATGLSKQDRRGSKGGGSDPYITVSFSKFGKPMYCTRVVQDDLNPVFEESCALMLTADLIKAQENLSMELWDSDRSSADDVVGKVELPLTNLIQHPGKMYQHVSKLRGVGAESSMPGELHWEVGFFGKCQFRTAMRTSGKDLSLPKNLRDKSELQDDKGVPDGTDEDAAVHTPPDPLWPSGILSVVVHQIVNLEISDVKGSRGGKRKNGREYEPARDAGEIKEEQGRNLPSAYATILINDSLCYKTRTKVNSSKPIYQAGLERFVRDWRSTHVTVAIRDSRNRQHDPILGVVPLKLSDVLQTSSQSTRWYPLDGGIGFGRIRLSLLFRSVELQLPPPQLGWDVGTFELSSDTMTCTYAEMGKTKVHLRTGGSSAIIKRDQCNTSGDTGLVTWDIAQKPNPEKNPDNKSVLRPRLPVRYRYRSPVFIELHASGKRHCDLFSALWLQDLTDNEMREFDLPVWRCDNGMRLSQNYITEANFASIPDIDIQEVGRLKFTGRFKAGTDRDHLRFVKDNDSRETIETWEACFAEGVRGEEVQKEVPRIIEKLHDESLTQGRDVLANASEKEKRAWLGRDGTDWTGAFGEDPNSMTGPERQVKPGESGTSEGYESESDTDSSDGQDGEDAGPDGMGVDSAATDLGIVDGTNTDGNTDDVAARHHDHMHRDRGVNGAAGDDNSINTESPTSSEKGSKNPIKQLKAYRSRSRDLHRQHRGLMQWRPMRNIAFAKDEAKFAVRRITKLGGLEGREPDVETEV